MNKIFTLFILFAGISIASSCSSNKEEKQVDDLIEQDEARVDSFKRANGLE